MKRRARGVIGGAERIRLVVVIASLLAPTRAVADGAETEPLRAILYDLRTNDPTLQAPARRLTDELLVHLGRVPELKLIGQAELELMVGHAADRAALAEPDCMATDACLTQLAEAASAGAVLSGQVGRLGKGVLVTLSLTDAQRGLVRGSESALADTEQALLPELLRAAERLLGRRAQAGSGYVFEPTGSQMAVIGLEAGDVRPGLMNSVVQLLSIELRRIEGIGVITRDEMAAIVDFAIDRATCTGDADLSCLVELGGALGADELLLVRVGRLGEAHVLHLTLLAVGSAKALNRVSSTYRGPEAQLPHAVRFAVAELLGRPIAGTGALEVVTEVEAELVLNGEDTHQLPLAAPLAGLEARKHALSILAEDFLPYHAEAFVAPGERVRFEPELVKKPTPWWASWWFWTSVGVVVVGGTVGTILALEETDASSGGFNLGGPR